MSVDPLLRSLQLRLLRAARGDADQVCAPEALAEAKAALAGVLGPSGPRVEVLHTVGDLHLLRRYALAERDPQESLRAAGLAFTFLAPVFVMAPGKLLPAFRKEVELTGVAAKLRRPDKAGDVGKLADLAETMLAVYVKTRDLDILSWAVDALHKCAYGQHAGQDRFRPGYLRALAQTLQLRALRTASGDSLVESADEKRALAALTEAVRLMPADDPARPTLVMMLAESTALSGRAAEAAALVDTALDAAQRFPGRHPELVGKAASIRRLLADLNSDPAVAGAAVDASEQALKHHDPAYPMEPTERALRLLNKAGALVSRYRHTERVADARAAVSDLAQALDLVQDHRLLLSVLNDILPLLAAPALDRLDDVTLQEVVTLLTRLAGSLGPSHRSYPKAMTELGRVLAQQHRRLRDRATADQAIEATRAAVTATSQTDPELPRRLSLLGALLYEKSGQGQTEEERTALTECIDVLTKATDLMPESDPTRESVLRLLQGAQARTYSARFNDYIVKEFTAKRPHSPAKSGAVLLQLGHSRFRPDGDKAALAASADSFRAALATNELAPQERMEALVSLSSASVKLAELTGDEQRLAEAVERGRSALAQPECLGGFRAEACRWLSRALGWHFQSTGDEAVLTEAVELANEDRALRYFSDDGIVGFSRYGRIKDFEGTGNLVWLLLLNKRADDTLVAEAVRIGRQAVRDCPDDHPERNVVKFALGSALLERHRRFGEPEDLAEATELLRGAGSGHWEAFLDLAEARRWQYELSGASAALDEAISLGEQALAGMPNEHVQWARAQAGLADSLMHRFERTGSQPALEKAAALSQAAVDGTPPGHVARAARLCTLATARLADDKPAEAARAAEMAAAQAPLGHPVRARALDVLGAVARRAGRPDDAARAMQEAVESTLDREPRLGIRMTELATVLAESERTVPQALRVARASAEIPGMAPSTRFRAMWTLGMLEARHQDWSAAADAFGQAVRLLPAVAPRNLPRADLEHRLGTLGDFSSDAAAVALNAGRPSAALEYLELGRGSLLSYALDARQDIEELRAADSALADEWERLRDQLDGGTGTQLHLDLRVRLDTEAKDVLRRIREQPGQENFLRPPSAQELCAVAEAGPIVCVNISEFRCDALVVTTEGVEAVPLRLTRAGVAQQLSAFLAATKTILSRDPSERKSANDTINEILLWLWENTVEPVLSALGFTGPHQTDRSMSRMWWLPTGLMNFLPLHAAGEHAEGGQATMDRVISSYTPSIRALRHARRSLVQRDRRVLGVGVSHTPGLPPLRMANAEAARAARLASGSVLYSPTRDSVLAALPWSNWVHFACHAEVRPDAPSASALRLWDGPLNVAEISALRLADAELAYLSACSTARGALKLTNESIHLASAFQLAGYRNVIATLWPSLDTVAARLSEGFYRRVASAVPPAVALHEAVRELRQRWPDRPFIWAGYLHVGA